MVVIASNYGQNPTLPVHNLRAPPGSDDQLRGVERQVTRASSRSEERERYHERGIEIYHGWKQYRKRALNTGDPVIE